MRSWIICLDIITSNCYKMLSISALFSSETGNSLHSGPDLQMLLWEALCRPRPWPCESYPVAMNMPWDETKEEEETNEWRQSKRFSMGEEMMAEPIFSVSAAKQNASPVRGGPSPKPRLSKYHLPPSTNTAQVSANIEPHDQIHEEHKHMWNDFWLTAFPSSWAGLPPEGN